MKKINLKLNQFISDVIKLIRKPVMSILPGQLSFFLLLSLIPIVLLVGMLASYISISTSDIADIVKTGLPADTSKLILPLLSGKGVDYNIIILIISALLLASKSTRSIMKVASIIYDIDDEKGIKCYIKAFILAIMLIFLFVFLLVVPVLSNRILLILQSFSLISNLTNNLINIINFLKWPISMFIIYINIKAIYIFSVNKKIPHYSVNKGALFTTILWVLITMVYSYYISHFSKYNIFYGGASNIIVLMLWVYFISYIFVLGMSINAGYIKNNN